MPTAATAIGTQAGGWEAERAAIIHEMDGVAWEAERRGIIAPDFNGWCRRARPDMQWGSRFFRHLHEPLDRLTNGELLRVLFEVAIRHSKTETVMGYCAYRLELDPATRILVGTHSFQQASFFSQTVHRLALGRGAEIGAVDTIARWETTARGGLRAVGVGTGTASINADLIVIDDPIGKRAQAESQAHRDMVMDWIRNDILGRAEPHTQAIFSMPRWHHDDPAAHLKGMKGWHVVTLPALAVEGDVMGRKPGELLWPELRPQSWVDLMRGEMGPYAFASQVQCSPMPREGGMFKWDWWVLVDEVPGTGQLVRYWDLAGTSAMSSDDPDYSAGVMMGMMPDRRQIIVDAQRFRLSVAARDARLEQIARDDLQTYRGRVTWWFERETGIGGKDRMTDLVRRIQNVGLVVKTEPALHSKRLRAEPLASKAEAGNVCLGPGTWRDMFRLEAVDFTGLGGKHDDLIDAAGGASSKVARPEAVISFSHVRI